MTQIHGFSLNTRIIFGVGALQALDTECRGFGTRVMLVSGRSALMGNGALEKAKAILSNSGLTVIEFAEVEPEPSLDTVKRGLNIARLYRADWVVGLGGGSAMDAAKTIAGLFNTQSEAEFYFNGGAIEAPGIPLVTIPTTAGSGAEITFNAVLTDTATQIKQSIRDPRIIAAVTIVDPQLMISLPETITAYSGMDALVQAIEAYTSKGAGPLTDIYAYSAVERIAANLLKAFQNGQDIAARSEMALGSLMAGVSLSNARLGAVHGMAHSIGIRSGKPHGLVCGVLLVPVMRFNLAVCYEKYAKIAKAFGLPSVGDEIDTAASAIKAIMNLQRKLGIPAHISDLGIRETDLASIVQESLPSGSLKANPRPVGPEDLMNILREAF